MAVAGKKKRHFFNGKNPSPKPPPRTGTGRVWPADMFNTALAYEFAGSLMYRHIIKGSNRYCTENNLPLRTALLTEPNLFLPMVVCSATAAEIYLKTLLAMEFKAPGKHHILLSLFNALSDKRQRDISKRWKQYCDTHPHLSSRRAAVGVRKFGIRRILWESQDAFKEWRYRYEGSRDESVYPDELCKVFRETILSMEPEMLNVGIDPGNLSTYPAR
ncbi:MAG: hypothetical protein JWP03_439 [Phycisphaerales bacterium]|jgi:hypothetical protein|nr:hypothetical protein [Phycisphaerales bacterium]